MQGKVHPYWFIPSSGFPCMHTIKSYKMTNPDPTVFANLQQKVSVEVNQTGTPITLNNNTFSALSNEYISFTFNSKVSEFSLIEKINKIDSTNNSQTIFHRKNKIKCYYLDDLDVVNMLSPLDNSLSIGDLNNLFIVDSLSNVNVNSQIFTSNGYVYVGRKFKSNDVFIYEVNPHKLAAEKNIIDYDFALIKFIKWDDIQGTQILGSNNDKAIISDYNYYPMGILEDNYEYWPLLHKGDDNNNTTNERLYFVRAGGYYGIAIREIRYLKIV